jgi:hypothetical protein
VLVLGERHLRRILARYFDYYHRAGTHLALDKDAPDVRPVELPGRIVQIPEVGGLHHRYVRRAAPAQSVRHDRARPSVGLRRPTLSSTSVRGES